MYPFFLPLQGIPNNTTLSHASLYAVEMGAFLIQYAVVRLQTIRESSLYLHIGVWVKGPNVGDLPKKIQKSLLEFLLFNPAKSLAVIEKTQLCWFPKFASFFNNLSDI